MSNYAHPVYYMHVRECHNEAHYFGLLVLRQDLTVYPWLVQYIVICPKSASQVPGLKACASTRGEAHCFVQLECANKNSHKGAGEMGQGLRKCSFSNL